MNKANVSTFQRLESIEVLRGLSATLVVIFHTLLLGGFVPSSIYKGLLISNNFRTAVPLFFAISAFSLLYGYEKKIFSEFELKRFYIRRFFRLAPLFYIMIIVWTILVYFLYHVKGDFY